ncbi:hypothetical protein PQU92_08780 [Asticcacaulis sp. BYS171W]|uniref:Phasin family protein n=1 Tax=Asticcacaulis aquaticus TaxID=2984212 RepID=A0ABT5HTI3_9CAUL|nr:phasin family protein [Asticcacaulis aquaticus]MDC7683367.1 hypothetical protein [Asticcacaulis aquaticus]
MADTLTPTDVLSKTEDTMQTTADAAKSSAEKGMAYGRDAMNTVRENTERMSQRSKEIGERTMNAYAQAGKQTSDMLGEVNKAMTDAYGRSLANYEDLSKQAMSVRTLEDVLALQNAAVEKMQDNMAAMTGVYSLFVSRLTQVMQPVAKQAADETRTFAA